MITRFSIFEAWVMSLLASHYAQNVLTGTYVTVWLDMCTQHRLNLDDAVASTCEPLTNKEGREGWSPCSCYFFLETCAHMPIETNSSHQEELRKNFLIRITEQFGGFGWNMMKNCCYFILLFILDLLKFKISLLITSLIVDLKHKLTSVQDSVELLHMD
uniref:Uncharacterized protein n=1 Tax=Glossina pallidipes TaxID=7398 RepID=A0A1A9ZBQ9_GLOPL